MTEPEKKDRKLKILFIYPYAVQYRVLFFKKIALLYEVEVLFTRAKKDENLSGFNYEILRTYFKIPFGLIPKLLRKDYDILIDSNWDSIPNLAAAIICFTIAKLRKKAFIIYRGEWDWGRQSLQRKIMSPAVGILVRYCDAALTYGTRSRQHIIKLGSRPDKLFIVPNSSVIPKLLDNEEVESLRSCLGIEKKKVVLYVGRLIKLKGLHYLIPAFAKLSKERGDIVLILIGEGTYKAELQRLCRKFQVEKDVYFIGSVKWEELGPYYLLANVFVLPSIWLGYAEAFGLVLNEAMSFGKPVIATDMVGASFELIKDGINGYVVPQKQIMPLYLAMKKITNNPEIEESMGRNSKKIIENGYTYTHMAAGFQQAIEYARKRYSKV